MGLREKLNENKTLSAVGAVVFIVGCLAVTYFSLRDNGGSHVAEKAFFTPDDGKTLLEDDITKLPPFEKDGKTVVRAHVYSCDGGKTRFVAYLQRYTPGAQKKLSEALAAGKPVDRLIGPDDIEFKRPGDQTWVTQKNPAKMSEVRTVKPPNGAAGPAIPVDPS